MAEIDLIGFYKSIADELNTIKDRVRNLIGSKQWGEEGRYKEAILRNIIKRFLPKNFSIGTGFVLAHDWTESHITSQIDIIVYDNTYPLLFQEGDFVIVTPQSVRAIIEVKTRVRLTNFESIIKKIMNNAHIIRNNQGTIYEVDCSGKPEERPQELFVGLFSYECADKAHDYFEKLKRIYLEERKNNQKVPIEKYFINNIVLSKNIFLQLKVKSSEDISHTLYSMKNLAYSYFIVNLLRSIDFLKIYMSPGIWFPFDEDIFKKETINLYEADI
jgi:hypothetical protein